MECGCFGLVSSYSKNCVGLKSFKVNFISLILMSCLLSNQISRNWIFISSDFFYDHDSTKKAAFVLSFSVRPL